MILKEQKNKQNQNYNKGECFIFINKNGKMELLNYFKNILL